MTIVISGIEIKVIDPPKPDFAIPYSNIAGTIVKKNNKFISNKLDSPFNQIVILKLLLI